MSTIQKIKKRNGEIVDFDPKKISLVTTKAFVAVTDKKHENDVLAITDQVVAELEALFAGREDAPTVEGVQDLVERAIMQRGYFDVAKSYIIYRYQHTKQREEKHLEDLEKLEEGQLAVVKRSGNKQAFSLDKIEKTLSYAIAGFEKEVNAKDIAVQVQAEVYDGVSSKDIARSLIMVTRSLIERDPAYSVVASRLLLAEMYKDVIGRGRIDFTKLDTQLREAFVTNIKRGVEIGRIDQKLLEYDLEAIAREIKPERDELLRYLGAQTLNDRYVVRDHEKKICLETPQFLWMRVAMGLALPEQDRVQNTIKLYNTISTLRFVPSTPTLFHAGTPHPQLSSCYLNTVGDSLSHIFKVYGDNAQLSKWSGGIGTDWTNIRGTGAFIKATGVESQGVIPFLKISNDATHAINRSGRRRGAACVYLETWHYDIESFLELRKNTGDERRRAHDLNTANWIPDLFIQRVRSDGSWTLFSPDETPELHHTFGKKFNQAYERYEQMAREGKIELTKTIKARDLWKKMINMLFETGHPWITFKDPSNIRSPQDHVGVVHNSNLCTEITLNTSEDETAVCNLGSVNYAKHVVNGQLDEALVADTVTTAMRGLDNVIDINFYPTQEAKTSNQRHRPVGLGVMGLQDALYKLNINFDTQEGIEFSDRAQELISYYAILASAHLAKEKGTYSSYKGSKWDRGIFPQDTLDLLEQERGEKIDIPRGGQMDWTPVREAVKQYGMRNSNCLAIAPTATISNIAGSYPSVEPIYKNIYVKANQAGDFIVVNPYLIEDLKKHGLWDYEMLGKIKYNDGSIQNIPEIPAPLRDKYKEVFEISTRWLMLAAAHRGKWIDQSQSLNIFFSGSSGKDLSDYYMYGWSLGLKTTYYLRTMAASQVEKSTVNASEFGSTHVRGQKKVAKLSVPKSLGATPLVASAVAHDGPGAAHAAATSVMPASSGITGSAADRLAKAEAAVVTPDTKLCRIGDPDCEACQ
ncbi:MAG: ribonucleoside-diphosphate reductase subunit alpha [bacterium]|nr:ribonucleoside-diphosphate reductase subunit alpha [bacterium]